jgi:hypothetical protein
MLGLPLICGMKLLQQGNSILTYINLEAGLVRKTTLKSGKINCFVVNRSENNNYLSPLPQLMGI